MRFPAIRTFDSSRTPRRGERLAAPRTLAPVDLTEIVTALAAETPDPGDTEQKHPRYVRLVRELAAARERIAALEQENRALAARLEEIAALAVGPPRPGVESGEQAPPPPRPEPPPATRTAASPPAITASTADGGLHPAARKLLTAASQHAPDRFTWGQLATLAGLKPSGGHFNSGRKVLREAGYVAEGDGPGSGSGTSLVTVTPAGLAAAGRVPAAPSTPAERLALWCARLPAPAPEMLRTLAAGGERYMDAAELANALGKKPTGGHWNSGIAVLRNNGLIEVDAAAQGGGRRYRVAALLRD